MSSGGEVFVVDDDGQARESAVALLQEFGFAARGFGSPKEALAAMAAAPPTCVVADLRMPEMDGTELQGRMMASGYAIPVIVVTAYGDVPSTVVAMRQGAIDVLEKPYSAALLVERVRVAAAQGACSAWADDAAGRWAARIRLLSGREREVCGLLLDGMNVKEIAQRLGIATRTVQVHRWRILRRLELESEQELLLTAGPLRRALAEL